MAFNTSLRRGLGARSIPKAKPPPIQVFYGVSGHGAAGSFNTQGVDGGPFSGDLSSQFGIGGSNGAAVNVIVPFRAVSGAGAVGTFGRQIGAIQGVSGIGAAGRFNIIAGANRSVALYGVGGTGAAGSFKATFPVSLPAVVGIGAVTTFTRRVTKNLTGVSGTGAVGTFAPHVTSPNLLVDATNFTTANWHANGATTPTLTATTITVGTGFWNVVQDMSLTIGAHYTLSGTFSGNSYSLSWTPGGGGAQTHGADNTSSLSFTAITNFTQVAISNASGSSAGTLTVSNLQLVQS